MIKVESVSKSFGSLKVLDSVSFSAAAGEFVAVMGKSGSGKSTLLNIVGALEFADSGKIFIDGKDLSGLSNREAARIRNSTFGYVFQSFHLEPTYTVYKNIEIPLIIAKKTKKEREERIKEVLNKVDLLDKINVKSAVLSGGEKQRVAIARALSNNPKIILADEPTGNLDTVNGGVVINLLKDLAIQGITVLLVTHNHEDAKAADRIIAIKDGKIYADA